MKINPEASAFPLTEPAKPMQSVSPGLSIRAHFASLAMQGQIAHYGSANPESIAKSAVKAADALIEELNRAEE